MRIDARKLTIYHTYLPIKAASHFGTSALPRSSFWDGRIWRLWRWEKHKPMALIISEYIMCIQSQIYFVYSIQAYMKGIGHPLALKATLPLMVIRVGHDSLAVQRAHFPTQRLVLKYSFHNWKIFTCRKLRRRHVSLLWVDMSYSMQTWHI